MIWNDDRRSGFGQARGSLLEHSRRHQFFYKPIVDELIPLGVFGLGIIRGRQHGFDGVLVWLREFFPRLCRRHPALR